jgi:hypothetical protein
MMSQPMAKMRLKMVFFKRLILAILARFFC